MPLAIADATESRSNPGNFQCKAKSKVPLDRKAEVIAVRILINLVKMCILWPPYLANIS
jgi:hypothetical protein